MKEGLWAALLRRPAEDTTASAELRERAKPLRKTGSFPVISPVIDENSCHVVDCRRPPDTVISATVVLASAEGRADPVPVGRSDGQSLTPY